MIRADCDGKERALSCVEENPAEKGQRGRKVGQVLLAGTPSTLSAYKGSRQEKEEGL